ncbi:uncharacterized protein LOC130622969 [Hydractinia symbiolongicarpus]|uniref:uncharacterized protein LOC130622969 n=1 Tax=Hydractinia symbiolongicarpus TaxID=13093 RepID=UPI00254EF836|nr:uncharacterized protein LOC130622969 [Hydractinia symbiolongicarpus]
MVEVGAVSQENADNFNREENEVKVEQMVISKEDVNDDNDDDDENNGNNDDDDANGDDGLTNYKNKYKDLKRKMKCLLYEQECFYEELRKVQRKCLRVNKDKSFLLDRLLQYEEPEDSSTDEEMTSSSEEEDLSEKQVEAPSNSSKKSASKILKKSSPKTAGTKSKSGTSGADKVRCRKMDNGKQCSKLVSTKVKSGICYAHRQQLNTEKQDASSKVTPSSNTSPKKAPHVKRNPPSKQPGGKDIGQIREAMEAGSHLSSSPSPGIGGEDEDGDLIIDVPQ